MTDNNTTPATDDTLDARPTTQVPNNDFGMPDFLSYFELVADAIPQNVVEQLPSFEGILPPEAADRARRHLAALTYVVEGVGIFVARTYDNAEQVGAAMGDNIMLAIESFNGGDDAQAPLRH